MKKACSIWLGMLAMIACCLPVVAAEPFWAKIVSGKRVEADLSKEYVIEETDGPWLIVATTFSGEGAEDQARDLVLELRRRYKLEAYTHQMRFDFSESVQGRGVDPTGQPMRMKYQRDKEICEIAVMVGHFQSVSSPEAQATLHKIKLMKPDTLSSKNRKSTSQSLASLRMIQQTLLPNGDQRKARGPMGRAFFTRNPLLPKEYFVPQGLDPLVAEMNQGVKYSLLDCQGLYTLKVATFTGTVVLDQRRVEALENGHQQMQSRLMEAAEKAHRLTLALRQKGYEAYEFHDRSASMVTVGSFTSIGNKRADGVIDLQPQIFKLMQTFAAKQPEGLASSGSFPQPSGAMQHAGLKPQQLIGIPFDLQPQLVQVPKASISSAFVRRED